MKLRYLPAVRIFILADHTDITVENFSQRYTDEYAVHAESAILCGQLCETQREPIMHENELSYAIRGAAFKVHTTLGPGLLESVYEKALTYELRKEGFDVKTQLGVPVVYEEMEIEQGFRMDILVNNKVIVEVKSVETLLDVHHKQLLTYLKLSDKKLGLLINFNVTLLKHSITRIVNKL